MIPANHYTGKKIAILGLGRSGIAAAQAFTAANAQVTAWDDFEPTRENAAKEGVPVASSGHMLWTGMDYLFVSPGVPYYPEPHPIIKGAKKAKCPIISDIDLLYEHQDHAHYIGITGTNGKSTTTALVTHIFNECNATAIAGGNIGQAAMSLEPLVEGESYILETSSYQLDLAKQITFEIAVLLNISADHLDRHKTMENYIAAKKKIFSRQGTDPKKDHTAIIGVDDSICRKIFQEISAFAPDKRAAKVIPVSVVEPLKQGIYCEDGVIIDNFFEDAVEIVDLKPLVHLIGMHNWQNAAAGYAVARTHGLEKTAIAQAITSFPGLPHRQQVVAVHRGIRYINDSKATNGDATSRALTCYKNIYWILGGKAKDSKNSLDILAPYLGRVKQAYCIGDSAESFAKYLSQQNIPVTISGTLDLAVQQSHDQAHADNEDDSVILLSPAAASFDQFKDFEDRGNRFRQKVKEVLAEENRALN